MSNSDDFITENQSPGLSDEDDYELSDCYNVGINSYSNIPVGNINCSNQTCTNRDIAGSNTKACNSMPGLNVQGILSKWTNYIHGWQDRFIVLKDGTLSYYKSQKDLAFGCRGSISILKATVHPHDIDECRFDVSVNDCVWYLRAGSSEEKVKWVEALEHYKGESGCNSQNSLRRHGSAMSISSNTLSGTSGSSARKDHGLKVKLAELETYRDILVGQIDTLQKYFDACSDSQSLHSNIKVNYNDNNFRSIAGYDEVITNSNCGRSLNNEVEPLTKHQGPCLGSRQLNEVVHQGTSSPNIVRALDFRGESITFKATTSGVLSTLSHCIELMSQRDDMWKKRIDVEVDKRKKAAEYFGQALREAQNAHKIVISGPDCEEGPHSSLKEDEFYDAIELGLDRMQEELEFRERLRLYEPLISPSPPGAAVLHPLWPEIDRVTLEQLHYARLGVGEGGWELFAEDGEMKMYKREEEVDGLVVDPLKAQHSVKGFTAHEMCHYFFSPDVRMEWETTLEQMTILEKISDNTLTFLQIHKRIWPATQRDALFWSHIREVPGSDAETHSTWIVCNNSTEHTDAPIKSNGKYIRVFLTVSLVCQTIIDPCKDPGNITRDDLTCRITYCSVVNPGGWAPASVLRAVYKREYPRFLKKFTQYVLDKCKDQPIMF